MVKLLKVLLIVVFVLMSFISCNKIGESKPMLTGSDVKTDTSLVLIQDGFELQTQIVVLRQFDSLTTIIGKQGKIIDSLVSAKSVPIIKLQNVQPPPAKYRKFSDIQVDSIVQSNANLRNVIKHQNLMLNKK